MYLLCYNKEVCDFTITVLLFSNCKKFAHLQVHLLQTYSSVYRLAKLLKHIYHTIYYITYKVFILFFFTINDSAQKNNKILKLNHPQRRR